MKKIIILLSVLSVSTAAMAFPRLASQEDKKVHICSVQSQSLNLSNITLKIKAAVGEEAEAAALAIVATMRVPMELNGRIVDLTDVEISCIAE